MKHVKMATKFIPCFARGCIKQFNCFRPPPYKPVLNNILQLFTLSSKLDISTAHQTTGCRVFSTIAAKEFKVSTFICKREISGLSSPLMMSLYVIETRLPFSINLQAGKHFTSMNLRSGSFLKPFNKLAVRVLSGIKHSAIDSCLYT